MNRCGKLVAKEIQKIIEVTHVTLAHRTSRSQAPETDRHSCHREHYHPSREDLLSGGSLSRMRNAGSARVHSHYTRMLADLPWQGIPVTVEELFRIFS